MRNAIAAVMREYPGIVASEVRRKLNAVALGRFILPRKRAIQLHMQQIRRSLASLKSR